MVESLYFWEKYFDHAAMREIEGFVLTRTVELPTNSASLASSLLSKSVVTKSGIAGSERKLWVF
jgi:hypothetical protein